MFRGRIGGSGGHLPWVHLINCCIKTNNISKIAILCIRLVTLSSVVHHKDAYRNKS